ncbi:glycolipid anchored surface protein [Apiospora kogelbergensis]|uniref:1,3-beta-glucanosyltransferase n=1 Tax=Apiospora kogelbergensis TaxID=1337665 RepID=A0AAW0R955_9PEZI
MRSSILVGAAALSTAAVSANLPTIEAIGSKFFDKNGKQFFMKGIAYQLTPDDPLVDTEQCQQDAALMQTLGANTIRVYHVDPDADHDGCMAAFADAGIYATVDMDTFHSYVLPENTFWNKTQLDAYTKVMDTFHKYDNLLGLYVGNEIIARANQSLAAPFIKAAARDTKAHRDAKGYRNIPIGYSAADIAELRPMLQDYLTCGGNASENVDFFGLNSYEWCDPANYQTSGYANLQVNASNFPVPIFFSETGCNVPGPRLFEDQAAIFGPDMVKSWSGAIIYEWIQEENNYGLISYGPQVDPTATGANIGGGYTRKGKPTPKSPDFENLKTQWKAANPTGVARSDYDAKSASTRECPKSTSGGWLVDGNVAVPTLGATLTGSTYSQVPSATAGDHAAEPTESKKSAVSGSNEIAGMAAGLVGVMMIFTFWL